jgi:RPA family protein
MKREAAWRVFAGEYNDSTVELKGEGEMTPSYVVTPLGAKINRLFIIGVLTDVENVSESGDLLRAHVSDPTGVFTLYSGQYQEDATNALSNIDVPAFVAVLGKTRTYNSEDGPMYVSIRPEKVAEVDAGIRDQWILETCTSTKDRIEAMMEAMKMTQSNSYDLRKLGYSRYLSEGIVTAMNNYENIDVDKYLTLIHESLQYLRPNDEKLPDLQIEKKNEKIEGNEEVSIAEEPEKEENVEITDEETKEESKDSEEIENTVLVIIKEIEGEEGASWDSITKKCEKAGLDTDSIEESINSLMDKGLIYEPVLGTIKTT